MKRCNITSQVGSHDVISNGTVLVGPSAASGQRHIHDSVRQPERRRNFEKDEWSMWNVTNGNELPFLAARVGVLCHDGSCRFWEWDKQLDKFIPFSP
jgi:hypothetical protein